MAKYRITAPDGGTYEISAPDSASEQDVLQYAMRSMGKGDPAQPVAQAEPEKPPVDVLPDMAKSFGSGVIKGGLALAALPNTLGQLANKVGEWSADQLGAMGLPTSGEKYRAANASSPTSIANQLQSAPSFQGMKQGVEKVTGPLYDPQTTAGKFAGTTGEFASGMLMPGGMVQKVIGNTLAPAVASEAAGQMTEGTAAEPLARIGGAMVGGRLANLPARAYTPAPATPERLRQVQMLDNSGVTALTAGQRTGNVNLRYAEDAAMNTPWSGARAADMKQAQGEQFTRAALQRAGVNADNVSGPVMDQAFRDIGQRFDQLTAATSARLQRADQMRLDNAVRDYNRITPPSQRVPAIEAIVADIRSHAGNPIPGPVYARYRSMMESNARALQARDPIAADALRDIRTTLDDAAERAMPAQLRGDWQEVRRHYRNLLVIEKAAATNGATEGVLTPSSLLNATKQVQGKRAYVRGQGDFADLARAGQTVLRELPNSGTAQRQAAMQLGQMAAGGALGAFGYGGPEGAAAGAVAPFLVKGMMARAMMSRPMQAYLANQAIPQNVINAQRSAYSSMPAAVGTQALGLLDDPMNRYPRPN